MAFPTPGYTESRKKLEQKFIFLIGTLNLHVINERFSFNQFIVSHAAMSLTLAYLHHSLYKPSVTHSSFIRSDEGLTLETSAFNLFTVANLPYQLS